jgi:hypothetical protein
MDCLDVFSLYLLCGRGKHRVHIFTRDETGLVYLPTQLERTATLLVMVNVMKGDGRAPPSSPTWAIFTLMMECTLESYSVYSVVGRLGWCFLPAFSRAGPVGGAASWPAGPLAHQIGCRPAHPSRDAWVVPTCFLSGRSGGWSGQLASRPTSAPIRLPASTSVT